MIIVWNFIFYGKVWLNRPLVHSWKISQLVPKLVANKVHCSFFLPQRLIFKVNWVMMFWIKLRILGPSCPLGWAVTHRGYFTQCRPLLSFLCLPFSLFCLLLPFSLARVLSENFFFYKKVSVQASLMIITIKEHNVHFVMQCFRTSSTSSDQNGSTSNPTIWGTKPGPCRQWGIYWDKWLN